MQYRDFTIVLSEPRAVADELELRVQVTEAAGLPTLIEPVRATCDLRPVRSLSSIDGARPLDMRAQLQTGSALGRALLPGVICQRFREALNVARTREEGLRLRVVGGDVTHCIPWEYVVLPPDHGEATEVDFLALMPDVSIVRDQSIPRVSWSKATLPLRIAATAAHPACLGPLDVERERASLQEALRDLGGSVELRWSSRGGRPSAAHKAQMFHFAGHGTFEPVTPRAPMQTTLLMHPSDGGGDRRDVARPRPAEASRHEGALVFEGPDGRPDPLSAGQLGVILREMGVRVAVLNACRTASRDGTRSWSSVAAALLKAGVRSVVAMQHAILDSSAIAFATAFYRALSIGGTLDEAARNGRMAVFDRGDHFGWGTPVLYLCALDGVVFPEARSLEANRTVLRQIDQQARQSYRSRAVDAVSAAAAAAPPAPQPSRAGGGIRGMAMAVSCLRCGKQARHEQPRRCEVEVVHFCDGCRSALLAAPLLPRGYRMIRELGRGGMGAVYRVVHPELGECALKLILPRAAVARGAVQGLARELASGASYRHPNLVSVLDGGEVAPGMLWAAMEHVPGGSLAEVIRQHPRGVDPRYAGKLALQMLDALAYVHRIDIVHRGVKPSNVLVSRDSVDREVVKLGDVGWARAYERAGAGSLADEARHSGAVFFSAPEHVNAACKEARNEVSTEPCNITPQADLYSTGAVLHRLLTGAVGSPAMRGEQVPASLAAVVERAMRKEASRRFRSAAEMQQALIAALDGSRAEPAVVQGR